MVIRVRVYVCVFWLSSILTKSRTIHNRTTAIESTKDQANIRKKKKTAGTKTILYMELIAEEECTKKKELERKIYGADKMTYPFRTDG